MPKQADNPRSGVEEKIELEPIPHQCFDCAGEGGFVEFDGVVEVQGPTCSLCNGTGVVWEDRTPISADLSSTNGLPF